MDREQAAREFIYSHWPVLHTALQHGNVLGESHVAKVMADFAGQQVAERDKLIEQLQIELADIALSLGTHNPKCIPEMIRKLKAELADWSHTATKWETEAIRLRGEGE